MRYRRPNVIRFICLVVALLLLLCGSASADKSSPEKPKKQPKIGLVLAGGGALGFAHVGVMEVLEEHNIPVHYVAGTSMGAIVGAAFAAGRSVEEMNTIMQATDWDEIFDETAPRESIPYRFKAGRNREIYGKLKIPIVDGALKLPAGIIEGQKILPLLQNLYGDVPNPTDFGTLPVPFRGVTADIETGKAVVFSQGDLAQVVRASMSVPGAFSPVEIDGKLLVDGGIANNLPVDQVIDMGADVLIVVELFADLKSREELGSLFAISGQIISILLAQNAEIQRGLMRPQDILVAPNLEGYGSTDFNKGAELIELGRTAARESIEKLKPLAVSEEQYAAYKYAREKTESETPTIEFVRLENETDISDERILADLNLETDVELDRVEIEERVEHLYDSGLFDSVTYRIVKDEEGTGVLITVNGKAWLKQYVRFGGAVEDNFDGDNSFNLGMNYRLSEINSYGAYLDADLEVGTNPNIRAEFYQPLAADSRYFIRPELVVARSQVDVQSASEVVAEYRRTITLGNLEVGRTIGRNGEIAAGVARGYGEFERRIGDPTFPEFNYNVGNVHSGIILDSLDTPDFPTEGYVGRLFASQATDALGDDEEFTTLSGGGALPLTFGRNTLVTSVDFASTFSDRPVDRSFALGGFLDISGFNSGGLIASDYVIGKALLFRRFSEIESPLFGLGFYGGGSLEVASAWIDEPGLADTTGIVAGSVFLGADTPLAPVYFGFGLNDEQERSFYFALGRVGSRRF